MLKERVAPKKKSKKGLKYAKFIIERKKKEGGLECAEQVLKMVCDLLSYTNT